LPQAYFIQYRFILPESVKHSSYTYQKLFRALYGYTQCVYKSNGKAYKYHRPGVLSYTPYLKHGKNCVVIPPSALQPLIKFFKTGINPTHNWMEKGNWKAAYYMNEKVISAKDAAKALELLLNRYYISSSTEKVLLESELGRVLKEGGPEQYLRFLVSESKNIIKNEWFNEAMPYSVRLKSFKDNLTSLTHSINP
jgi:hypothetical protein